MAFTFPDAVGIIGVTIIVAAYFLSQLGRIDVTRPAFPAANGVGALLILYSLAFSFNLASFVIEILWLAISMFGLVRALRRSK